MFYAGRAAQARQAGNANPVGEAVKLGYLQERLDQVMAPWSAYSYEDLPSDRLGAVFGGIVFNANGPQTLSQQIESFLNLWGGTSPLNAPNINNIPQTDRASRAAFDRWRNTPQKGRGPDPIPRNTTTTPMFTLPQPSPP